VVGITNIAMRVYICVRRMGWVDRAEASPCLCEEHRRVGGSSPNIDKDSPYASILQSMTHARLHPSNSFPLSHILTNCMAHQILKMLSHAMDVVDRIDDEAGYDVRGLSLSLQRFNLLSNVPIIRIPIFHFIENLQGFFLFVRILEQRIDLGPYRIFPELCPAT
jgi:hypothetical protein